MPNSSKPASERRTRYIGTGEGKLEQATTEQKQAVVQPKGDSLLNTGLQIGAGVLAAGVIAYVAGQAIWNGRNSVGTCGDPKGLKTITMPLNPSRFAGTWYVHRRFNSFFEKEGLVGEIAHYGVGINGGLISVVNTGYDSKTGKAATASGSARLSNLNGVLLVSFFMFVEAEYPILYLTQEYDMIVVGSSNRKYLWCMTRTPSMLTPDQDATFMSVARDNAYTDAALADAVVVSH